MARQDHFTSDKDTGSRSPEQESAQAKAGELKEEATRRGKQQAETGKERAAEQAENAAAAAERISEDLRRELPKVADYTAEIADSIRDFANRLRHRSIDDLLAETQELARRNPTLFFLGSAAVGVALSRFFKASAEPEHGSSFPPEPTNWNAEQQPAQQTERHVPGAAAGPAAGGSGLT